MLVYFLDKAIEQLQRAIALTSHQPSLWNNLGQALYTKRDLDSSYIQESINAYEQALQLQPDLIMAYINLGLLFQEQGDNERAIAWFRKVLEQNPDHVAAHSHCARLHFRQGRIEQAIDHWQQLATLQSHLLHSYYYQFHQEKQRLIEIENHHHKSIDDLLQLERTACAEFLYGLL